MKKNVQCLLGAALCLVFSAAPSKPASPLQYPEPLLGSIIAEQGNEALRRIRTEVRSELAGQQPPLIKPAPSPALAARHVPDR